MPVHQADKVAVPLKLPPELHTVCTVSRSWNPNFTARDFVRLLCWPSDNRIQEKKRYSWQFAGRVCVCWRCCMCLACENSGQNDVKKINRTFQACQMAVNGKWSQQKDRISFARWDSLSVCRLDARRLLTRRIAGRSLEAHWQLNGSKSNAWFNWSQIPVGTLLAEAFCLTELMEFTQSVCSCSCWPFENDLRTNPMISVKFVAFQWKRSQEPFDLLDFSISY